MFDLIVLHDLSKPMEIRLQDRLSIGPYYTRPDDRRGSDMLAFYTDDYGNISKNAGSVDLRMEIVGKDVRLGCDRYDYGFARLPHGRGFLPMWSMGPNMIGWVGRTVYDSPGAASRAGYSHAIDTAEQDAEDARREYEENEYA